MLMLPESFVIKISQIIHGSLDLEVVYQAVVDEIGQYLQADRCFITRFDSATGSLCAPTREYRSSNQVKSIVDEAPVTLWGSLSEYACGLCQEPQPIDYHDLHHTLSEDAKVALEQLQVHSGLSVAIRFQQCLGILFVQSVEAQRIWSDEETQVLNLIAHQVAAVTHHADLYQHLEERSARRQLLNQLYQRAIMGVEPHALFDMALDLIGERLGISTSKIIQFSPKKQPAQPLKLVACRGLSPQLIGQSFDAGFEPHSAYTLEAKEPVVVTNICQEKRFSPSPLHQEYGLMSGVAVVIWGPQQPYGVLEIDERQERRFPLEDIQFLEAVANLLGTVLERKHVEKLAYKSEQQFKLMVEGLQEYAVAWLNPEGIIESWNAAAEKIFGYSAEEILGQSCKCLYLDEDILNQVPQQLLKTAAEHGQVIQEGPKRCREGKVIYCEVTITALYEEEEQLLGYVAFAQDISARRQAELALKASEERFRSLVEGSLDYAIYLEDLQGRIMSWNPGAEKIYGYTATEIVGGPVSRFLTQADIQAGLVERKIKVASQTGRYEAEGWRVRKDGSQFWAVVVLNAVYDENGNVTGFTNVTRDITKRKQVELALKESESRFRWLVDSNIVGVVFWNVQGQIIGANEAFLEMLGYCQAEVESGVLNWRNLTPSKFLPQTEANIRQLLESGRMTPCEKQYQHRDGHMVDVLVTGALFEGSETEGVAFVVDITQRKQLERQLAQSNRDLAQFAAVASHDLKAPLRKVGIFYELIQEEAQAKLSPDAVNLLQRAGQSIQTMQTLISDLLAWSQVSNTQPVFEKIDLTQVLNKVQQNLERMIQDTGAHLEIGTLPVISGDEAQLVQFFQNLVENGLKYQPPGQIPVLHISGDCIEHQFCQITVRDNGIGFKAEYAEKIFQPFQRLHGKSSPYPGTGIGLAICQRIAERHGGSIRVESIEGQGSSFHFLVPIVHSQHEAIGLCCKF